jgi:NADH-quinone oxidoreductase subunit H
VELIDLVLVLVKIVGTLVVLLTLCAYTTLLERKLVARFQTRIGPNRAGPGGLLQPLADLVKLVFKEDLTPTGANRMLFTLAPFMSFVPAFLAVAVIPWSDGFSLWGHRLDGVISDLNIGLLFLLGVSSLGVYALVLAGWASNSKYSLLGGLRSSAQMISYEVGLGLSVVGVLMLSGTLSLTEIVRQQATFADWFLWKQPLGFLLYLICGVAETNRAPFDLPECENELVAGYHTEYSSIKFAMFYVAEYANMVTISAVAATLFLGGWNGPWLPPVAWFLVKVLAFLFLYVWLRATLPRLRYDQLMKFGWLVLLPAGLINVLCTAALVAWSGGSPNP